jgi:hypothetical protein
MGKYKAWESTTSQYSKSSLLKKGWVTLPVRMKQAQCSKTLVVSILNLKNPYAGVYVHVGTVARRHPSS